MLLTKEEKQPFKMLLDDYHQCFHNKDIDALREMYVQDEALVYFDNHADCDSRTLADHLQKVSHFFDTGSIVR